MSPHRIHLSVLGVLVAVGATVALAEEARPPAMMEGAYPGLVSGALASAALGDLPPGVLLRMGEREITVEELDGVLAESPESMRDELRKSSIFLLQEMATSELLLRAARDAAATSTRTLEGKAAPEIISRHLQELAADVTVTEQEVADFYESNADMFGGAKLQKVREPLAQFLLKKKRQEVVDRHVRALGGAYGVVVSAPWVKEQAVLARDNPVDKARSSGKPTLVDFGADGCRPCDMMAPILDGLREELAGKANIVFVHVRQSPVLAARYGIRSIPVQVFFDKDGEEVFRHAGFFAQEDMEQKLAELGVK